MTEAVVEIVASRTTIELEHRGHTVEVIEAGRVVLNESVVPAIPFMTDSGRWHVNSPNPAALVAAGAGVAGRFDVSPWLCPVDMTINAVGLLVNAGVAAGVAKVACYEAGPFGRPETLLFQTGDIDCSAAAFASVAQAHTFVKGRLYWLGVRYSTTFTLSGHQAYCSPGLGYAATPTTAAPKLVRRTLAYATAAPSPWGYSGAEEASAVLVPAVFLRVA